MERRIRLKTLNEHIVCTICTGYLIDATTVTECLHTCKFDLLFYNIKLIKKLVKIYIKLAMKNKIFYHVLMFSALLNCMVKSVFVGNA